MLKLMPEWRLLRRLVFGLTHRAKSVGISTQRKIELGADTACRVTVSTSVTQTAPMTKRASSCPMTRPRGKYVIKILNELQKARQVGYITQ